MADKNDKILSEIYQNAVENGKFTREYRARLPKEERELLYELEVATGERRRKEGNFLEEIPTAFINAAAQRMTDAGRATGETLNEFGFNADGMVDFFNRVQEGNKQWDTPEDQSWYSKLSTTVGSAAGSTLPTLAAGAVGSLIAPGVGTVAGLTAGFMQTFGDNVDRNRKAGYSEDKALGMAFLESAVDTTIENLPFGIIGKGAGNAFRAARATVKGHGKLLKAVGKQIANTEKNKLLSAISKKLTAQLGKKNAENLLWNWGKSAAMDGLGEAGEEALQYINSWANQKLGGDPNAEFSFDDFTDAIAQGLIGGFFLQAARSTPSLAAESYRKRQRANAAADTAGTADNQLPPPPAGADTTTVSEDVPEYTMPQTSGNVAPVTPAGAVVSDAEAQIIADIDNMSDEAVRAAVGRMNMPKFNAADTPVEFLRKNLIDFEIARHRSEVEKNAAVSATAAGTVSTPVTAENSIARETLTPETAPIVAPEVAETANIPASSAAPVAPVTTPAPAAAPSIQSAVTPVAETPINDIPEYTMPDAVQSAEVEYTPRSGEAISEPENILSYSEADENLNDDFDVDSYSGTPSEVSATAPEAQISKNQRAINEITQKVKEQFGKQVQIDQFDTKTIKDEDLKNTLIAAQRIFKALGMGKVVMVNVDDHGVFKGATIPGNEETGNRAIIDAELVKGNPADLFHTAMHELVHNLIGNNEKAYLKFKKAVMDKIYNKDYYNELFENYLINRGFDLADFTEKQQAAIEEEFICDTVADLMQTEKFWEILTAEDMSFAQKLLNALKDLLAKITSGKQNDIPIPQQVFADNLNDVISLAQQFVIEAKSSKKDISSLIRAKNKTETTATTPTTAAEPSVPSVPSDQSEVSVDEQVKKYEERFGNVINTDNAKLLFVNDGYDPHDAESVKQFHVKAGEIVRNLFDKLLKDRKGKGNGFVVFTGGGNGSGKSSVMTGDIVKNADFVFDSAMVNYEAAKKSIQQVIDNGQTPLLAFVYRNPADAWFNGVLKRNQSADGHIVPDGVFANTHAVARDTFLKLVDEFGNKVQYIIKEVADGKSSEITIEELKNKPKYTKEQIKEAVNAESYSRARAILDGFEKSEQSGNIQRIDGQRNSADGRSAGGRDRAVSAEQQAEVIPQKTPTLSDKIRKKPEKSEPSDQSEVSDRQTFSDKFRAKEKEITGVNNPNIIIAESTPQGLKSVEKGDTLKETETSAKTITEDKSNDKRTLGGNTGLSSDTNASAPHDGVSETTSDRTAGEKGTGGVSGSDVRKSDGTASAGKSSVAAESGLRNSDGDGSTAGRSGEQKTGEVVSGGNRASVQNVERASSARVRSGESASAVKKLNANNFRITPETNLVPAGDVSKTQANIEAIKLIKTLDKENRQATAEEKQILAKYTGWGGLSNVFYPGGRFYSELKSLLTQKEFQDAQASTINAHYTERGVISAMWDVASHLGFKGGKVGEFGAGVGHFLGLIPDKLFNKTAFKAVELDTISGKILQYLYPGADVTIDGLEHVKIANNSLDMVIGNFPFAKEGPYDRNYPKFNLHNYFFARAIDAVKPGGLVVALTSNSTLDSINQDARKYFAERADFVGAIRLPNNAFKKNAGTEVVTDIIVFRKHDGTESNLAENKVPFLRSVAVDGVTNDENNIRVNEYFVNAHPDMVLGKITSQGSMYRGDSMTVEATTEPDKLPGLIEKALKKLPKDIMGAEKVEIVADTADIVLTDEQKKALREGEVFVDKLGTPMIYQDGKGVLFTKATDKKLSQNEIKKIQSFVKLKETYNSLMETMRSDASDAEVKKQQQQLNKIYDEHVKKFGYLSERRKYTNLVNDPGYLRMSALENKETITDPDNPKIKKTVYKKSDVFTLRTIKKAVIPTHADNASDAAIISINYTGKLDFQFMEKLTGKPAEQIKSELLSGGNFFVDPASGLLVEKEEYLSGNIAQKIFEVEQQITENPELSTNLEALKAVLPQPKEIGKISFNLGATWMPSKVIEKWIKSVYNVTAKIRYSEKNDLDGASAWKVEISNPGLVTQFNIGNRDIEDLIEDSLNLRRTKVYGRDSNGKPYLDKEKTQTANSLQEELKRSFVDFVRTDSESATAVEKVYNDTFNVFVERKIDPAKCLDVYPGASDTINGKPFRLRDHQKAVVSRCIRGNTLIAHCVGAGKTVEMITANMELIRLGLASKGLILVQKSTLGQFAEEAQQLYPNARILAADAKSMEKKNRRRFLSKIANGSWDMVIMPHPSFDNLLLSPELQRQQIEDAISEVVEAINEQKAERNSRLTIKELERKKKALTAKLEKLQSRVNEEDTFYFDELGFDAIFVDEAHNYKKLDFHTKLGNIKGLDKGGSSRAFNMKGKLDFIRSKTGGRNIYFATGTPVTNTLAEVWNMIRFVSPETLEEFNVRTFDQFAATFTATVNAIEQNAAGNWKAVERFSEITNIEELHKFVSSVMDIILPEDLKGVKRPTLKNGKPTYVTTDRTEELTRFVEQLKELYEAFDAASGAEKREYSAIPLMIYGLAKKASIDMRLINESFPDDPNSKLNAVVENAFSRYKELSDVKGTQAIFCDMYRNVDKKTGQETFNVYKELKRKLVEKGVPESEIAIINDYTTDSAKEKLFELVNAGEVRFVMGSTQKLGTGVNIQEKLAVLHHIDAPPRPSDMEQRDGRIIRQGNTISEPEILCYAVDKTLDSFSYAMLARKAKFINMALKGKVNESGNLEVTDDDVIDYAAFSAETSGDKRAVRYVELNKRADELENAKRRYQKNVYDADGNIERYTKSLNTAEKDIKSLTEFIEKYGKFDLKTAPISLNGRTLTGERGEILSQLDKQVFDRLSSGFGSAEISIGDLGIRIKAEIEYQVFKPAETKITYTLTGLEVSSASGVAVSGNANTAQGLMQSLGAMLKKKSSELDMLKEKAKSFEGLIEQQKKIKNSKFEFADELDEVIKERDELQNELANEAAEKGKDKKHLTLPQAAAMLGLSSEDFLIEDEDADSDLKLSAPGDRASGTFTEDDGTEIKLSLRNDRPPQKTKTGYKVFAVFKSKPGELFPPMVANPGGESTPTGVWLNADAAPRAEDSKTGRPKVQAGGKGTNAGKQTLAYRPGWHLGEVPQAKQFNRLNKQTMKKDLFPKNFVWAECEFAADVDYQKEAESYGYNAKGNFQYSLAGLPKIPVDGYYKYRTNPDPGTEPWFITGAMRVKRLLTDAEVNKILKDNGYPEMKRQGGEMDLAAWGFDTTDFETTDGEIKLSLPGDRGNTSLDPVDYRRSIDPLFDFFMEYSDNGILNPGSAHIGEDFSGAFISPEFVAYSVKRKQGKNEADATYRKYLERRQSALENASGASLDTMAKEYVEKFGGNEAEVAEKFLDMLRHLTKKDLISERAEAKREVKEAADKQRKEDEAEWRKQKAETLRKKVDELFKAAKPVVDKRWIQINRQIYTALFKTVFPDAETIPDIPSDREMRILNMVLENGNMSEAALIAEPYYTDKDKVLKDKLDKAQAETLTEFILRSRGGKGFMGLFRDINGKPDINLLEYALMTPMWIAKKFAGTVVESIYKAARMMVDDKNRIMRYLSGAAFEKLMQLRQKDKAMYDKLNAYILKCDRDQTGAGKVKGNKEQTEFTATTADGEVIGKFDNEENAWDALFKREQESLVDNGYSELAAESLYEIRSAMRRSFLFRLHSTIQYLRQAGLIDAKSTSFIIRDPEQFFPGEDIPANQEIDLFELMREMGQRSGYYMPRIRHGKYMLRATKAGHPVILKGFDSKLARAKAAFDFHREGYKTENFLANTPDQDMLGQLNPAALSDILNHAMERAKDVFSKDIQIDEVSYVTKDGKTVPQLAVTSKMKLSYSVTNTLKKLGGRYYDGAWRFDNFTPETKTKLKEIIESEVTNEVKTAMVMQSVIGSSIVDMIRENSSGSSKIARRTAVGDEVVQGYEEDVLRAYGLYISGVSGASARNVMAKKMYAAFGGMDFDREEYINSLIPENLEKGTPEYQEALTNATAEYFKEVHRRALNSAKSPRIAKYMDKYIKDMLRNSTSLDRVLGAAKGISAVWMLNKPASAINNLFGAIGLVPAVIDTETKCGVGFALGNMLSGLNKYIKYAAYNKWGLKKGKSNPLTEVDSRIFDIIHKNSWDGAEMVADATKAGLTFANSKYQAFSNFMLGMFSMVESGNRASSIYAAAMALAKKRGVNLSAMNDVQLQDFLLDAVKISDFGNGVYDKTNKLTWARGGDWQSVIDSALLFKTYEVNYYNNMWNMFNHKNLKGLLYTTISILAMGGGKASIPVTLLLGALSLLGITDPDDEEESDEHFYNWLADVAGQGTANVAKYGIPSLLGINLSGTYRDTITDALHDGVPDGTISISDLLAYSIFKRYKNMKEYGFTQPGKMVEEILPAWLASGSRAIREKYTGVTDRAGRQRKDVNNEYIKPDTADFWIRIGGFNPVSISEKTDRIWTEKKVKEKYAEQRREIYSRYRDYMKSGDTSDSKLAQLALDIEEYNAKVARSNRNIPLIDEAGLNRAAKDTESKFLKSSLDEKAQQRREKKEKGKIVIRNGKFVREE